MKSTEERGFLQQLTMSKQAAKGAKLAFTYLFHLLRLSLDTHNHRIIEEFGLEGTLNII